MQRDHQFEEMLRERLARFDVRQASDPQARAAAVTVTVVDAGFGSGLAGMPAHEHWSDAAALVLTKRAQTLRRHAGQWALPGGRIDSGETAHQAALRELNEEIDLVATPDQIIGQLDDVVTRSGFVMTPVVVLAGRAADLTPNPDEVASIHRIPVSEFLRDDAPMLSHTADNTDPELKMPVGQTWIAAPTAAILYQFREVCLLGKETRVDRFGQPKFTWR